MTISGWLIIAHGIGTWIAGYFPMDKDPYTKSPSLSCKIHSLAGLVMLFSLLISPVIIAASQKSIYVPFCFRLVSVITASLVIYYLVKMAKAYEMKKRAAYYQRISYWLNLVWLSVFSLMLAGL
ncbi:DUF998 domain-containing protein [Pseudoalteromonas caenipelagi]|uniref:DUF998 domain-containing protein n=1 Tax=Pseudoalteromonas caenipelagi TaxID=2726988 RepID=UPI0031B5FDA1